MKHKHVEAAYARISDLANEVRANRLGKRVKKVAPGPASPPPHQRDKVEGGDDEMGEALNSFDYGMFGAGTDDDAEGLKKKRK